MRFWTATLLGLAVVAGCEARSPAPSGNGASVPEGCPETDGPFARGRVLVPETGGTDAGETDAATSNVGASGEVRREVPAREVRVTLSGEGKTVDTRTDANGRWCLGIGERDPGMTLVARAEVDGTPLRRPVITRKGQIISVRSEAVLRVLEQRLGDLSAVSPAVFLNLEAVASTATDLLDPIDWRDAESIASVVEKVETRIAGDSRFTETLERLEAGKNE